ncbi:MAG: hypothetical protein GF401_07075 [Chitinivibrionales bacterium]|nr:hypothetical protein [Chitinivibrionales bacterium]
MKKSFLLVVCLSSLFLCIFSLRAQESVIQNAVLEGIQLQEEPGDYPDEVVVTCYFIFRDKPTSYFYDINMKEKKLIFEFNDTEIGSSPIPSQSMSPITGFEIEKKKINVNEEIKGLQPEWHDLIVVTFSLDAVPDITVHDQYGVVTFSYKWTKDPTKVEEYAVKEKKNRIVPITLASVGGAGVGALLYFLLRGEEEPPQESDIPINDLPQHTTHDSNQ